MGDLVKFGFGPSVLLLPLSALLPLKVVPEATRRSSKYRQIAKSIGEVGIIEPLVVAPSSEREGRYLLLDGHMRYTVLIDLAASEVRCLVANDDEAYTYNKRVSRLATIQEHLMIVRAIERGVSEEKLAKALNLDVKAIKRRRALLDGICPEIVEELKDKSVSAKTFEVLRKMKPMRQVEAAQLMCTAGNYSASYSKALLAATRQGDLVRSDQPKRVAGMTAEQMARMEREMEKVQIDLRAVESGYGEDVLQLVIASGYLSKLTRNPGIKRYLGQHHPEILAEFHAIISATSLDRANTIEDGMGAELSTGM
jgi:ParB-like chromosome segregation protein Spo0J